MKLFLAGTEPWQYLRCVQLAGHDNALFSYYHSLKHSANDLAKRRDAINARDMEIICDSGLFTLMFGSGKGQKYGPEELRDYTKKYIARAKTFGIKNLTIVEMDVHKILGMPAVFELRKYFEDSGFNVLYVWHKEEGLDGLMRLAEKYPYIALSIPEFRILLRGRSTRYQQMTKQLLQQIKAHTKEKMPKVHLLGNTVQETMETTLAYSCDSTSWLSGSRYGNVTTYSSGRLKPVSMRAPAYQTWLKNVLPKYNEVLYDLKAMSNGSAAALSYLCASYQSALAYKLYQDFLNRQFPWEGLRNGEQGKRHHGTSDKNIPQHLEPQRPV